MSTATIEKTVNSEALAHDKQALEELEKKLFKTPTDQEIMDLVGCHLLNQGVQSKDPNAVPTESRPYTSRYSFERDHCAAGVLLMRAGMYNEAYEGHGWKELAALYPELKKLGNEALIARLQRTHDSLKPDAWAEDLRQVALEYGLDMRAVYECIQVNKREVARLLEDDAYNRDYAVITANM
jgi:hypothetical protein